MSCPDCATAFDQGYRMGERDYDLAAALLIGAMTAERDRLRVMLKEIGNQAANINHHCYQTGKLQCVACASSQELIEELARAALEGRE